MKIYSIYRATNIVNKKVYIGFDSNWPNRKDTHKSSIYERNSLFYNAIRKYGFDNFCWEIIYQSIDGDHTLNVMESYFIKEYRSFIGFVDCNGYNMTLGGDGALGRIDTVVTTERRRNAKLGKKRSPLSEEQKIKISNSKKGKQWSERRIAAGYTFGPANNPMRDPGKVAKMLATRKLNKMKK